MVTTDAVVSGGGESGGTSVPPVTLGVLAERLAAMAASYGADCPVLVADGDGCWGVYSDRYAVGVVRTEDGERLSGAVLLDVTG